MTQRNQKDILVVQWKNIMSINHSMSQDMTKMYEMASAWDSTARKEFLNKNKFQYKSDRERKEEFDRVLHEWINLGRVTEFEMEILK